MLIAVQPDNYGANDSSSAIWSRILVEKGHKVREVDVYAANIFDQLKGCNGFMWRHGHIPGMRQIARRLLPVLENELGLIVYPDQKTCWHYDDKIAQAYLFEALSIPAPKTWIWYDKEKALDFAIDSDFPMVLKLWAGAGSANVILLHSFADAEFWIQRIFDRGVHSLSPDEPKFANRFRDAFSILHTGEGVAPPWELHKNYVLFQEFLAGNDFDTRVTVIGDRAFAFRRFNRPNDFRASGSGNLDVDPLQIDKQAVKLAFSVAEKLQAQSVAIDILKKESRFVVGEISYTYASWAVKACPGYWDSSMQWHERPMWPEEAQIEDFLKRLERKFGD